MGSAPAEFMKLTLLLVVVILPQMMECQVTVDNCTIECLQTYDGNVCQSICNSSTETVQDDIDEIGGKEESIIEAGKVYNSRLNVVVYSLISGLSVFMVTYAVYLTYRNCKERNCQQLESSSRDVLCSTEI